MSDPVSLVLIALALPLAAAVVCTFLCASPLWRLAHLPAIASFGTAAVLALLALVQVAGTEGGIIATGGVFPGSSFAVSCNVIATQSTGVRGGVDNLTIEGNEISGMQETSGDAIVIEEGVDAVALDRVRVADNRIASVRGNAILVNQRVETATVAGNLIDNVGLGALVMGTGYGPVTPSSSAILVDRTPENRRAFVFSLKQTGVPIGGALAGAIIPALILAIGWKAAMVAVGQRERSHCPLSHGEHREDHELEADPLD